MIFFENVRAYCWDVRPTVKSDAAVVILRAKM